MPPTRLPGPRLESLVREAREPAFVLSPDQRIVQVNRAWEELTGHPADQVVGLSCDPLGPTRPDDLPSRPSSSSTLILRPDGERLWRRLEFWPFHDAKGSLLGLFGLVRPVGAESSAPEAESRVLRVALLELRDRLLADHGSDTLLGRGPRHKRLLDQVAAASASRVPVLIVGEAGTGKRLVARTIHLLGASRQSPVLVYDCRALPPEVLERELFGTAMAHPGSPRALVAPAGSTLILGEILELPRDLQGQLAAALRPEVRLVATTSGDVEAAFAADRLRPDLYHALTTLVIPLPSLRDRLDEIPLLALHFLERANLRNERQRAGFSTDALTTLKLYDWPGNLGELARVVDAAHGRGEAALIERDDIPPEIRGERGGAYALPARAKELVTLKEMMARVERRIIERALARSGGNRSRAARRLGINRPFLYRRMKELGLAEESEPPGDDPTETA